MGKSSNELVKSGGVLNHVQGHPNITPFTTNTASRSSKSIMAQTNPSYHQNSSSFPHFTTAKTTPPPPTCCSLARHHPHHQHNQGRGYTFGLKSSPLSEDNHHHHHHECMMVSWPPVSYTCSFCRREFRSAQALGGHMNIHRRDRARLRSSSSALTAQLSPPNSTSTTPPTSLSKPISVDPHHCLNLNLYPKPNPSFDNIHSQNNTCTSNVLTTTVTPSQSINSHSTILELNPPGSGFISNSRARCVPSHQYSGRPVRPAERRRNSTNFDPKNFLAMRSVSGGGGGDVRVNNNPEKAARSAGGRDDHNFKKSGGGEKLMVKPGLKKLDSIHRQSNHFCGNDGDGDHGLKKKKGVVLRDEDNQMMIMGETRIDLEIGVGALDDEDGENDQGDVVDCGGDVCQVVGLDLELRLGYKF